MEPTTVPDLTDHWFRTLPQYYNKDSFGNLISLVQPYVKFNSAEPDLELKEQRCCLVYIFGREPASMYWTIKKKENGSSATTEYFAILIDKEKNLWAVSKPNKDIKETYHYDDYKALVAITLTVETETGVQSIHIPNPNKLN